ncbi:MAG TPA: hypothetical protein DCP90_02075 [Clostridiales bacterium]|nr:MAG: hypothetical protein A2Y22_08585 [Clostridiales bacterium GWD2_32_59]HAN09381.1 hypothetical protein [Clostridiales bacterium]
MIIIQLIEFAEVMGYLSTVYGTEVSKERVKIYFELLKDIDIRVLTQVIKNISAKEKYFPTPANIRQESVILTTNKELTVDESIQLINKAINNYGFYKTVEALEYIKEQDEKTYQIVKSLGFRNLGMTNMGVWLNCVKSMYNELKETKKNEQLLPLKFQADINRIKMLALTNQEEGD